jgi:kinesin family protein 5
MVDTVFNTINNGPDYIEYRLKVSLVEIYMEKIRDLLDVTKSNLKIRENKQKGVYIQDVSEEYVSEDVDIYNLIEIGTSNRAIGAT